MKLTTKPETQNLSFKPESKMQENTEISFEEGVTHWLLKLAGSIDAAFGEGHAKQHPELLPAC